MMAWILGAYIAILLIIALLNMHKIRGIEDFFVAGRARNTLELSGSLTSTILGASALIGVAGLAYSNGFSAIWWLWSGSFFMLILAFFLLKSLFKYKVFTLPELLGNIYGGAMEELAGFIIVISWLGVIAGQIVGMYAVAHSVLHIAPSNLIILFGAAIILYTAIAGQFSVIRTDVFQGALFAVAIFLILINLNGAKVNIIFVKNIHSISKNILFYFTFVGLSFLVGPDIFSRIFSAKNYKVAKKSLVISAVLIFIFSTAIVLIGIYAKQFTTHSADAFLATINGISLQKSIFYLIIIGLFAALFSSADTVLLTSSIIFTNDILKEKKHPILYTRVFIAVFGIFSIILALYFKGIIALLLYAYSIFISSLIFPTILGLLGISKNIPKKWLLWTVAISALWALANRLGNVGSPYYPLLFNMFAMLCLSLAFKNEKIYN